MIRLLESVGRSIDGTWASVECPKFKVGATASLDETAALVTRLEAALRRLEVGSTPFSGACAACLQDVANAGHPPSCYLVGALDEVREWWARSMGSLILHLREQEDLSSGTTNSCH